jgi:hypothetical protein
LTTGRDIIYIISGSVTPVEKDLKLPFNEPLKDLPFTMLRLFAGTLGWVGLGIIVAGVINNYGFFDFKLTLPHALTPAGVYLAFEIALRTQSSSSNRAAAAPTPISKIYQWILGLVGLLFLISLPFLWWEVIKKLAGSYP